MQISALSSLTPQLLQAENLLVKYYTNTDYTIIRPGGLVSDKPTVRFPKP